MDKAFKGFVQVYTGDGKGKTTAALGLLVRAMGAGLKTAFVQFLKKGNYSEIKFLKNLPKPPYLLQIHSDGFVRGAPNERTVRTIREGWHRTKELILSGEYELIVLDELNLVLHMKILELKDVLEVLKKRPPFVEVVITGRYAPEGLVEFADLVTEMKNLKHYFEKGVRARLGIEK